MNFLHTVSWCLLLWSGLLAVSLQPAFGAEKRSELLSTSQPSQRATSSSKSNHKKHKRQHPHTRKRRPQKAPQLHLKQIEVRERKLQQKEENSDSSGFVTVIEMRKARLRVRDLAEVVNESAGVRVRSFGGLGSWSTISIRGSSSNQVQIFLDGVPLNHGGSGSVNLSDLPLDSLEQVEIHRGFVPPHLGGAIGGAIQLVTRYPENHRVTGATLSFGSFRTTKLNLHHAQRHKAWQWTLFARYLETAGDFSYFDDLGTPLNLNDDIHDAIRKNNHLNSFSALAKVTFRPHRRLILRLSDLLSLRLQGVPGIGTARSQTASFRQWRNLLQLSSDARQFPHPRTRWRNQLYLVNQGDAFSDPDGEIGIGKQMNHNQTLAWGAHSRLTWLAHRSHEFSMSASLRQERFSPFDALQAPTAPSTYERWQLAPAFQYLAVLFDERLHLTAGGRMEMVYQPNEIEGNANSTREPTQWLPVGRIGLKYRPLASLSFKANVGRYVRLPTFWELFGDRGVSIGNPRLTPETGLMWDAGFSLSFKKLGFIDFLRLEYAFFWTMSESLIRFVQNSQSTMIAVNIAAARMLGHEARVRLSAFGFVRLQADLTWMASENLSESPFEQGKRLPGRPEQELSLRGELRASWGSLFYAWSFAAGNVLDRANLKTLPPRQFHTIGATLRPAHFFRSRGVNVPWEGLTITLEFKNLLDARVEQVPLRPALPKLNAIPQAVVDYIGYPLQGRSFYLTVDWKF